MTDEPPKLRLPPRAKESNSTPTGQELPKLNLEGVPKALDKGQHPKENTEPPKLNLEGVPKALDKGRQENRKPPVLKIRGKKPVP